MNERFDPQDAFTFLEDIQAAPLPSPNQRNRAKEHLMKHIADVTASETPSTAQLKRRSHRGRWFAIAATTAAAASIAAVMLAMPGDTGLTGSRAAGAAELRRIATVAAEQQLPGTGDILHFRSSSRWKRANDTADAQQSETFDDVQREVWVRPDRSWILSTNRSGTLEVSANAAGPTTGFVLPLADIPADATRDVVERALRALAGSDHSGRRLETEVLTLATDALRETNLSPNVRSKLFQIIADSAILDRAGTEKDRTGRTGTAFDWTDQSDTRRRIIIDPNTSQLLEEQIFDNAGEVEQYGTYLVLEYVGAIPNDVLTAASANCGAGSKDLVEQCQAQAQAANQQG